MSLEKTEQSKMASRVCFTWLGQNWLLNLTLTVMHLCSLDIFSPAATAYVGFSTTKSISVKAMHMKLYLVSVSVDRIYLCMR